MKKKWMKCVAILLSVAVSITMTPPTGAKAAGNTILELDDSDLISDEDLGIKYVDKDVSITNAKELKDLYKGYVSGNIGRAYYDTTTWDYIQDPDATYLEFNPMPTTAPVDVLSEAIVPGYQLRRGEYIAYDEPQNTKLHPYNQKSYVTKGALLITTGTNNGNDKVGYDLSKEVGKQAFYQTLQDTDMTWTYIGEKGKVIQHKENTYLDTTTLRKNAWYDCNTKLKDAAEYKLKIPTVESTREISPVIKEDDDLILIGQQWVDSLSAYKYVVKVRKDTGEFERVNKDSAYEGSDRSFKDYNYAYLMSGREYLSKTQEVLDKLADAGYSDKLKALIYTIPTLGDSVDYDDMWNLVPATKSEVVSGYKEIVAALQQEDSFICVSELPELNRDDLQDWYSDFAKERTEGYDSSSIYPTVNSLCNVGVYLPLDKEEELLGYRLDYTNIPMYSTSINLVGDNFIANSKIVAYAAALGMNKVSGSAIKVYTQFNESNAEYILNYFFKHEDYKCAEDDVTNIYSTCKKDEGYECEPNMSHAKIVEYKEVADVFRKVAEEEKAEDEKIDKESRVRELLQGFYSTFARLADDGKSTIVVGRVAEPETHRIFVGDTTDHEHLKYFQGVEHGNYWICDDCNKVKNIDWAGLALVTSRVWFDSYSLCFASEQSIQLNKDEKVRLSVEADKSTLMFLTPVDTTYYSSKMFYGIRSKYTYGATSILFRADRPEIKLPEEGTEEYEKYRPTPTTSAAVNLEEAKSGEIVGVSGGAVKLDWSDLEFDNSGSPITGLYVEITGKAIGTKDPKLKSRKMALPTHIAYDEASNTIDAKLAAGKGKIQISEGSAKKGVTIINLADTGMDDMSLELYAKNAIGYGDAPLYAVNGITQDMIKASKPAPTPTPTPDPTPTPTPVPTPKPTPKPTPTPSPTPKPTPKPAPSGGNPSGGGSSGSGSSGDSGQPSGDTTVKNKLEKPAIKWEDPYVTITHSDKDAKLFYSLDNEKFKEYTGEILVTENGMHEVVSYAKKGGETSDNASLEFEYWGNPDQPVINYNEKGSLVTITAPADSKIKYHLDDSDYIDYPGPFKISRTIDHTVYAYSVRKSKTSSVVTKEIPAKPANVVITVKVANNTKGKASLSCKTKDADIFYYVNGGKVTLYKGPFTVKDGDKIKAYSIRKNVQSDISKKIVSIPREKELKLTPVMTINKTIYKNNKFRINMVNLSKRNKTEWVSENNAVAKVNKKGVITALKPGKAKVVCISTNNGKQYYRCTINVTVPKHKGRNISEDFVFNTNWKSKTKMPVVQMRKRLNYGSSVHFGLKNLKAADSVKYSTSNKKVAVINNKGIITPKRKKGHCFVTAKVKFHGQMYIYRMKVVISKYPTKY